MTGQIVLGEQVDKQGALHRLRQRRLLRTPARTVSGPSKSRAPLHGTY
ncbi:hypothetical protein [Streptomyces sp. BHT-5-2]|nr:hypothetical protein [Streptomyces sp. BHT-5-2]